VAPAPGGVGATVMWAGRRPLPSPVVTVIHGRFVSFAIFNRY